MFRDEPLFTVPHVNFLLPHAALGDMIASLPAIAWARKHQPKNVRMTTWVPEHQMPLVRHLFNYEPGGEDIRLLPIHTFKAKIKDTEDHEFYDSIVGPAVMNTVINNTVTRNRIDLVEYAYMTLTDRLPVTPAERSYLTKAPLGPKTIAGRYVVLAVNGTTVSRTPSAKWLTDVIIWLLDSKYKVIITGKKDTIVKVIGKDGKPDEAPVEVLCHYDKVAPDLREDCVDLRDSLDLLEFRDLCGHACAVVGWDGGALHLAGTTHVPIVYGCTTVLPRTRCIWREGQLNYRLVHVTPEMLKCAGCATNMTLMFDHDFRHCAYKDNLCVDRMNPGDTIGALYQLGAQQLALY